MMTPELIPHAERLAAVFASATAPTFFLGAVAAFASLLTVRSNAVLERMRTLNAIGDSDLERVHLKDDLARLMRRARLLKDSLLAVLIAGVVATVLLGILFVTAFLRLEYAYGAAVLFIVSTCLLGFALLKFAQEAHISLGEADKY